MSEHGLQPGAALHPEQPQVPDRPAASLCLTLFNVNGGCRSLLQHGNRLPANLHVLYEQRELRCGADRPEEPAGIRSPVSRSGLPPVAVASS